MALSGFDGAASYDFTASGELDLRPELHAILLADTAFMGRIGMGSDVARVNHYWLQDSLNASTFIGNGAITDSGTSLVVTTAVPAGLQIGALLMDTTLGKHEVIQVTAISSLTLTVVRAYGDSAPAGEAHADGAVYRIVSVPKPEGDANVTDESKDRERLDNVCQIFKKEVSVSDTRRAENSIGVGDEFAHSMKNRLLELKRQLNMAALLGVKKAAGSDSAYRSMDGVINFVRRESTQLDETSEALSESVMNDLYSLVWDAGGDAETVIASSTQIKKFASLYVDKIRLAPSDRVRGVFVNKFLTNLGQELDLLIERFALPGDLLIMKSANVKLCALQGRGMKATPLAKTGDSERAQIVGEYTLEVFNPEACFALHRNLTA